MSDVTIYSLAKEIGVTPTMVSRAFTPNARIAPEKRRMILREAEKRGFVPNKSASRLSQEAIKIGVVVCRTLPEFDDEYVDGVNAAACKLADFKVNCELHVTDEENLNATLLDLEHSGCKGIVINGIGDVCDTVDRLRDKGIKIAFLGMSNIVKADYFISCYYKMEAEIAAEMLSLLTPVESKKVLMFTGDTEKVNHHIELRDNFKEAAERYGLELVGDFNTYDKSSGAIKAAEEAFEKCPEPDGIYVSSANCLKILEKVKELGLDGKVKIITTDVFDKLKPYIDDGTVNATLYQNPFRQAKCAFEILYRDIAYGSKEEPRQVVDPTIVIRSNWQSGYEERK